MSHAKKMNLVGALLLSAGSLAAINAAEAAIVSNETGNGLLAPYFVNQSYISVQDNSDPSNPYNYSQVGSITSNNTGLVGTSVSDTLSVNGATVSGDAWSISNGFYSARNYASLSVTNANSSDSYYAVAGYGTRTQVEFFTGDALATRSVFTWRVTGTETQPLGWADARIDFLAGQYQDQAFIDVYDQGETHYGPGTYTYNLNATLNTPIDLFFWSSAFVQVDPGVAPQGSDFTITANYGSTYELIGIDLYDANDNLLTDWTMKDLVTGNIVFNQTGRLDQPASVPEPGTLGLMGLGLLGAAFARRRKTA